MRVEVIHAKKRARIFQLELRPAVQIRSRELARISQRVPLLHGQVYVELQEIELELREDFFDLTQCEAVLPGMEQEIAAATRVVEILQCSQASEPTPSVGQLQIKSELTNPFRRRLITSSDDKVSSGSDVPTSKRAIKTDMHDTAWPQYRPKNAPTCHWILEMVQDADALDEIEGPSDGS